MVATFLFYFYYENIVSVDDAQNAGQELYSLALKNYNNHKDQSLKILLNLHNLVDEWMVSTLQQNVDQRIMEFDYGLGFWAADFPYGEDDSVAELSLRWLKAVYQEIPRGDELRIRATMQGTWHSRYCVPKGEAEVLDTKFSVGLDFEIECNGFVFNVHRASLQQNLPSSQFASKVTSRYRSCSSLQFVDLERGAGSFRAHSNNCHKGGRPVLGVE